MTALDGLIGVWIVDVALGIVALQAAGLIVYWNRTGRGIAPRDLLPNLMAGACLMVALRFALSDAPWPAWAGALAIAGIANAIDLKRRWRS